LRAHAPRVACVNAENVLDNFVRSHSHARLSFTVQQVMCLPQNMHNSVFCGITASPTKVSATSNQTKHSANPNTHLKCKMRWQWPNISQGTGQQCYYY
jgi:hypothetical protein